MTVLYGPILSNGYSEQPAEERLFYQINLNRLKSFAKNLSGPSLYFRRTFKRLRFSHGSSWKTKKRLNEV